MLNFDRMYTQNTTNLFRFLWTEHIMRLNSGCAETPFHWLLVKMTNDIFTNLEVKVSPDDLNLAWKYTQNSNSNCKKHISDLTL